MSDEIEKTDGDAQDDSTLAKLLKLAGPRAEIPLGVESRTYERVRAEWKSATRQSDGSNIYKKVRRAWRRDGRVDMAMRWALPLGGVASALIAMFVLMQPAPVPAIAVATVSKVVEPAAGNSRFVRDMTVYAGESLLTGEGEGLSLLLARSESLRIDENTELQVDGKDRFTLLKGRVYVDTGQFVYRDGGLTIDTEFASVTDVGTQFSVSAQDHVLDVAVREGRVDIANDSRAFAVMVGERMTLDQNNVGNVSKIDGYDEYWNWVADLAPEFDIEKNRSLFNFLEWAARETGRELIFEDDELRMSAMRDDVFGRISNLTPDEALLAILPVTSVRYKIEPGKIAISR